jgi:HD-like signal output (HDOD) protein
MIAEATSVPILLRRLNRNVIESRLSSCPRLPSLRSIDSALRELLHADQRYTQQIAEVIRRDPSLTARLLRLVNSVYYGLSTPVSNLEEAVLYLGLRQIRQLVMVTPILEDFQRLTGRVTFSWREFWQHCIGTAILTREVMSSLHAPPDETDYVAGLVHDVGKIVMAYAFPDHFQIIYQERSQEPENLLELVPSPARTRRPERSNCRRRPNCRPPYAARAYRKERQPGGNYRGNLDRRIRLGNPIPARRSRAQHRPGRS